MMERKGSAKKVVDDAKTGEVGGGGGEVENGERGRGEGRSLKLLQVNE